MGRSGPMSQPSLDMPESGRPVGLSQRQLDDALAAEYVLEVLDRDERAEAEARLRSEPGFAALVAGWQTRMADSQTPPPAPRLKPVAGSFPRLYAPRVGTLRRTGRLFRDATRFLAGMAVAAGLVLVTIAFVALPRPGLIARLAAPDNRLSYEIAEYGAALKVTRVAGEGAVGDKVHELWLIAPGQGPVSIAVLDADTLVIDRAVPPPGSRFAVSLEPKGGALGGRPTGPMILMAETIR